jgi:hypothetical protein
MATHRGNPVLIESSEFGARGHVHPALAWAGVAAPVVFTGVFLIQEAFRRDEYNPLAEPVSALEAGPAGWIQQVNFVIFGLLTIGHAIGQHAGMLPTRRGVAGPLLLALTGVGALVSGFFPIREDAAGMTEIPAGHLVGGLMFFLISPLALILLAGRMRRDPAWASLAGYTLVSGLVLVALDIMTVALVFPDDGLLHQWAGLIQRITILAVLFPCRVVLAVRLLTVPGDRLVGRAPGPAGSGTAAT